MSGSRTGPENRRRRRVQPRLAFGRYVVVFSILGSGIIGFGYYQLTVLQGHESAQRTIVIRPKSSARQIVAQLHAAHIIRSELPTLAYITLTRFGPRLKAGDYRFQSPISSLQVIHKLLAGDVYSERVIFPEGLNRFEIAAIISQLPIKDADKALLLTQDVSLIADLDPSADSLEGYLFPDTYEYTDQTTAQELITRMVSRFNQVFTSQYKERAEMLGLTIHQVITLASLLEKEAKISSERALISSVFHNRLKQRMKLDCDPTVIYAALLAGKNHRVITKSDLARKSPYNTYASAGLPPGPIASPGRSSIEAALYPADTDYLYFVRDASKSDGSHRFAASLGEHAQNVTLYRRSQTGHQRNSP